MVCAGRLEAVGGLPVDMWALILEIRAVVLLQAAFRSFRVRHGPLRYLRKYVAKQRVAPSPPRMPLGESALAVLMQCVCSLSRPETRG